METIGAYEAKTHFSELLQRVENGEEFTITKHGRVVAQLRIPEPEPKKMSVEEAIAGMNALQKKLPSIDVETLISWKHEGHRY